MRHFREAYGSVIDFTLIEAPFECQQDPEPSLEKFLGQNKRFRSWFDLKDWATDEKKSKGPCKMAYGLEENVKYIAAFIEKEGPFDGVLCFSQGGIAFRHFHRIT